MTHTRKPRVEILAVGSEFLTPHFQETNSLYLTQRVNDLGLEVAFKTLVGDRWDDVWLACCEALGRSDVIFSIGGLGPTADDITREAWASATGRKLLFRPELLEKIRKRFARRRMKMPAVNKKQAYVIEEADVLENTRGTAPGLWLETEKALIVLLPGPPQELIPMFEKHVWPRLKRFQTAHVTRTVLKTAGMTESAIENLLVNVYPRIPEVRVTTLARPGQIEIHLTSTSGKNAADAERKTARAVKLICAVLGESVFTATGEDLEAVVGRLLRKREETLAVAESCTGGFLGNRITNIPGSSAYFLGGTVAYSNHAKQEFLGVPQKTILAHGAVSHQVARAMATGVRKRTGATYGLAITGIAGPQGGTPSKPVGLVYTALSWKGGAKIHKNLFLGNRNAVKFQSSQKALDMLRRLLISKSPEKKAKGTGRR